MEEKEKALAQASDALSAEAKGLEEKLRASIDTERARERALSKLRQDAKEPRRHGCCARVAPGRGGRLTVIRLVVSIGVRGYFGAGQLAPFLARSAERTNFCAVRALK